MAIGTTQTKSICQTTPLRLNFSTKKAHVVRGQKISPPVLQRISFQGHSPEDTRPEPPSPGTKPPGKFKTFLKNTQTFLGRAKRKFTSWTEFRQSVSQGYQTGKTDLMNDLHSSSKLTVAKRLGMEALGVVVTLAFVPFSLIIPGPNPGLLVSPTTRAFLKGFFKETPPRTVEQKPHPSEPAPDPTPSQLPPAFA